MTVDLSKYVGQEVEVTFQDGKTQVCKVTYDKNYSTRPYLVGGDHYTKDGYYWSNRSCVPYNIVKVTPIKKPMKKYEKLEQQVKEIQAEIDRLKKEEKEQNKLPEKFNRDSSLKFLENFDTTDLIYAFDWRSSPLGYEYWSTIYCNLYSTKSEKNYKVPNEAIIQIQSWVIESYKQQYEGV